MFEEVLIKEAEYYRPVPDKLPFSNDRTLMVGIGKLQTPAAVVIAIGLEWFRRE